MLNRLALVFPIVFLLVACNSVTPEKYFTTSVLNMNFVANIGSRQLTSLLQSEPLDLTQKDPFNKPRVTYEQYVQTSTVPFTEDVLKRVSQLPVTDDTREMIEASKALFSYALRLYKEEYPKIAALKDRGVSQEELDAAMDAFDQKYHSECNELYGNLFNLGMAYAKKHNLNVTSR